MWNCHFLIRSLLSASHCYSHRLSRRYLWWNHRAINYIMFWTMLRWYAYMLCLLVVRITINILIDISIMILCFSNIFMYIVGHFCPVASFLPDQMSCPRGSFCVAGSSISTPCSPGYYGPDFNMTISTCSGACSAGYFCLLGSTTPTANPCPGGCVVEKIIKSCLLSPKQEATRICVVFLFIQIFLPEWLLNSQVVFDSRVFKH